MAREDPQVRILQRFQRPQGRTGSFRACRIVRAGSIETDRIADPQVAGWIDRARATGVQHFLHPVDGHRGRRAEFGLAVRGRVDREPVLAGLHEVIARVELRQNVRRGGT